MADPSKPKRTVQVIFKVTTEEKAKLVRGAQLAGSRRSKWMRDVLLGDADRLIAAQPPEVPS